MSKYLGEASSKSDRVMVIGCIGETIHACPSGIPGFYDDFTKILLANSASGDVSMNRNVAYAIGLLAEQAKSYFPN